MARSRILVLIDLQFTNKQSRTLDLKPLRWHKMCSSRYTRLADLLFLDTKPIACQDNSCLPRAPNQFYKQAVSNEDDLGWEYEDKGEYSSKALGLYGS